MVIVVPVDTGYALYLQYQRYNDANNNINMTEKYRNKYRTKSTRLQNWDYRWTGAYFITICTQNRIHYFGEIVDGKMNFSNIGVIADILWHEIPIHAKNVELGAFVVMTNHIHGILILNNDNIDNTTVDNAIVGDTTVETGHALSLPQRPQRPQTIGQQRFQNIGKNSVSSIIGGYKSAVTKHARRFGYDFAWQSRFYDHIIRDEKSFNTISNYIINNPVNWKNDKFHKDSDNTVNEPPAEYNNNLEINDIL